MTIRYEYDNIIAVIEMDQRKAKIIAGKAGGTAGTNSKTYKISLPTAWVREMDIDGKEVELSFDGGKITITPQISAKEFVKQKQSANHCLYRLGYYDKHKLCTVIYADFTDKTLKIENRTDDLIKTAFGKNTIPDWNDFEDFLEERCVPRNRMGIREYLEEIGVDEYEPFEIIKKTQGRMAEDKQWLKIKKI